MSEIVEFVEEVCGLCFRSILLPMKGMVVPQHVHPWDHPTYVGAGAARLYVEGEWVGDYYAGHAVPIKAGQLHAFEALEPWTRLCCIVDADVDKEMSESIKRKGF